MKHRKNLPSKLMQIFVDCNCRWYEFINFVLNGSMEIAIKSLQHVWFDRLRFENCMPNEKKKSSFQAMLLIAVACRDKANTSMFQYDRNLEWYKIVYISFNTYVKFKCFIVYRLFVRRYYKSIRKIKSSFLVLILNGLAIQGRFHCIQGRSLFY